MTSKKDMLKFLTQRFKTQTLNDVHPYQNELDDDDRDSGTESDENPDLDEITDDDWNENTKQFGSGLTNVNSNLSPVAGPLMHSLDSNATHEISENNLDSISCTSDYERQSLDFDRHSSEDELETIHKEIQGAEKRKWSQVNNRNCNSAGSSDEEVKELMLEPQPVLFSSSPPKDVQKVKNPTPPPSKIFMKKVAPVTVTTVSPRKRHRQTSTSDTQTESGTTTVIQRPCLDFEKMQKNVVKKQCTHNIGRAKIVKIRTVNGGSRTPQCMFDPAMFSFQSISSTGYSPLTPVEEPSCAY